MAKKKKSIELTKDNISFQEKDTLYKLLRFYPDKMTIDTMVYENGQKQGMRNLPFAHLPKDLKKIIKPN
jgi:hypothetical protein